MLDQITGGTRLAAVIGDPVRHSLSPQIHNAAFAALGLDWAYVALPVVAGSGAAAVEAMRTFGISGLNVTMPHKADVASAVDRQTESVAKLNACNCVFWDGKSLVGDNTDGDGFVASLKSEIGADPSGMRVAILGAGGAAKAIIDALARAGAAQILVINRSADRARKAAELAELAEVGRPGQIPAVDLVVNATSVGMGDSGGMPLDPAVLRSHQIVADIVYRPFRTPLLVAAAQAGATPLGGLGMLVHQAAASFERFTGMGAPLADMTEVVRSLVAP